MRHQLIKNLLLILVFICEQAMALRPSFQDILLSQGFVEVPIRLTSQGQMTPFLDVSFGDTTKHAFILDTGSVHVDIDPHFAQFYKRRSEKGIWAGGGDSQRRLLVAVDIPKLQLGKFSAANVKAYVMDNSFIKLNGLSSAGKLGLDFLRHYQAIVDIQSLRLYLNPHPKRAIDFKLVRQALLNTGYQQLFLATTSSGHQVLTGQINQAKLVSFLLDTGVPNSFLSLSYAKSLQLPLSSQPLVAKGAGGGAMQLFKTGKNNFSIGKTVWTPESLFAMDFKYISVGTPICGVMGIDWMQAKQAIIDIGANMIYIK